MRNWKRKLLALISTALASAFPLLGDAAPIPLRGIVEGFYGTPWTQANRLDMMDFCGAEGLNAYIYAPKDDPYHRAKWREPYPASKLAELRALVAKAKENNVKFIFAVSPGLDLKYSGKDGAADRERMRQKLTALYDVGVRDFAIFFDDIKEKDGRGQAEFLNWLTKNFVAAHDDISPLITVPTEYYRRKMETDGRLNPYTQDFSQTIMPDILVLYTGEEVVPAGITDENVRRTSEAYGRPLGIWLNYPVNDYMESKLALGPVKDLPKTTALPAIFFNPMKYEQLSKIALATGADYAKDPENYVPQLSWERAISEQYRDLAPEMALFADQSQQLKNSWAFAGRPDGQALRESMDRLWGAWPRGANADEAWQDVNDKLTALLLACQKLQKDLPPDKLAECQPQLKQMERLAAADKTALELLRSWRDGERTQTKKLYAKLREEMKVIQKHEKEALISDGTALAFLDETIAYLAKKDIK